MWCYQKPGFEAFLLSELQKQQQCSDFCDTLLKAEGVSVPAHSCVLSAISPCMSSALSATPTPPAGQNRLLEFRALGACTLLHMVRLLYSGEMTGEGEEEKQEAISAAAKLGIHGLVEVTKRDYRNRRWEGVGHYTEVGVQTESLAEGKEGRQGVWRREVRDGSTLLWKETQSNGGNDMWTQTEEQQINAASSAAHSVASFETIDMETLQSLGQTDSCLTRPQIVPMSVVYPPNETQPFSARSISVEESTTAGSTSVAVVDSPYADVPPCFPYASSQTALCAADLQTWLIGPQEAERDAAAAEEWEDERFDQFQGNIPAFINYFLNPVKAEGRARGRAARRRGGNVGRPRSRGTGESRARGPRAGRGRGRGGFTQKVDVQEVGVGRVQRLYLHRFGTRTPRTGQGGGAIGRKLYLNTREIFKSGMSSQRRRGRGKMWEFSQSGGVLLGGGGGGGGHTQRGRKTTAQQFKQDSGPVGRSGWATSSSAFFSYPLLRFSNLHTLPSPSPVLQPSPSTSLLSPAASYTSPESSLLHTTPLPPSAPSAHDEQPEHIDRLLEEVMMGLDILPKSRAPHSQVLLPGGSSSNIFSSSGNTSAQNRQQCHATDVHRSTEVAALARGAGNSGFKNGEAPVLQQQCEGELNEMLDHFLQSFEQHVESHGAREEKEINADSSAAANQSSRLQKKNAQRRVRRPQTTGTETLQSRQNSAGRAVSPKHDETLRKVKPPPKCRKKRKSKQYQLSLERKKVSVRKPVSSVDATAQTVRDREDKQLKQRPVVHLERSSLLPARVILQRQSCLADKSPEKAKICSSSVKTCESSPRTNQSPLISTKTYPIRSRFKEEQIMDSVPFLEEPLSANQSGRRRGRPRKNSQQLSLLNSHSSVPPAMTTDEPPEKNQERHEEESTVQPQEEADRPASRGQKRAATSTEDRSDDATVTKRVCLEQIPQPTCETSTPNSEPAIFVSEPPTTEPEEAIDVETVSLSSLENFHEEEDKPKAVWSEIKLRETEERLPDEETYNSADEIIDVEGDDDDSETQEDKDEDKCKNVTAASPSCFVDEKLSVSPLHQTNTFSPESTESWEEDKDIDVVTGCTSVPEPVVISWTESSEEEEPGQNIDVEDRLRFIRDVHCCE